MSRALKILNEEMDNARKVKETTPTSVEDVLMTLYDNLRKRFETEREEDSKECDARGCLDTARFEGWANTTDPLGFKTGLSRKVTVCGLHVRLLKGYKEGEHASDGG
jgi:hypothetical protein